VLHHLIGPALFSTCPGVKNTIMDIQMNPSFKEFGKDVNTEKFRSEIASFKAEIEAGVTVLQLLEKIPDMVAQHPLVIPLVVRSYLQQSVSQWPLIS
jgi:hypothetical protein